MIRNSKYHEETLSGQLLMINNITLNRFAYYSHPAISQMLRYKEFDNINKAITVATAEEKALRLIYKENPVKCKNRGRTNHTTVNYVIGTIPILQCVIIITFEPFTLIKHLRISHPNHVKIASIYAANTLVTQ